MVFHPTRVHIGTDHAAYELKEYLVTRLQDAGYEVADHGAHEYDSQDDYPRFCIPAAQAVVDDAGSLGLVLGGSGNGEQIAAMAREHNDANVLSLGGRMQSHEEAWQMVEVFLTTEFTGEERHQRRIDELTTWEQTGRL